MKYRDDEDKHKDLDEEDEEKGKTGELPALLDDDALPDEALLDDEVLSTEELGDEEMHDFSNPMDDLDTNY